MGPSGKGVTDSQTLRVLGSTAYASQHLVTLMRSGYFEDEDQINRAPLPGDDENFDWKVHPVVEKVDKSRGSVIYRIKLDSENIYIP